MADVSIGTARGTVRIEYESVGADKAASDLQKLRETQLSSGASMANWANQVGVSSGELKRFNQIQQDYINAQKIAIGFEQRANQMRRSGASSIKDLAEAQLLASNSRKGLADLREVLAKSAVGMERDMSLAGTNAARKYMDAQLVTGAALSHRNGRAMSAEITRALSASGVPGGMQAGRLIGASMGGGMLAGVSVGAAAAVGVVVAAAAAAAVAVTGLMKTLQLGMQDLVATQDAVATLDAIGTSGEKINGILKITNQVAEGTRFSLDEMAMAAQTAFISGIDSAEQLTLFLQTVADSASVSHKPFATMALMLQQMKDTGKLSSREIRQLATVGPILDWVAERLGKTRQATQKLANGAGIDFQIVEEAIEKHIGGASKRMGGFSEESARLRKTAQDLGAALLRPLFGDNLTNADLFAKAIKTVREKMDEFVKYVESHRAGLVTIWADVAKVILSVGFAITNVGGVIMGVVAVIKTGIWDMLGALARGVANLLRGLANVQDFFGADGAARDARKSADAISHWGDTMLDTAGSLIPVTAKIFGFNKTLKDSWNAVNQWADGAKDAKDQMGDLGSGSATKEMITITDALEKIGVSQDEMTKGISGSSEDYAKFLELLKDKGAPDQVIETVKRLRSEFENGGRAAMNLSRALKNFGDSSIDAASRTKSLISALKEMGILPGAAEDALAGLNEEIDKLTGYDSKLVDMLDRTGESLIAVNGHIDTTTKNGRSLKGAFDELLQKGGEAVASGQDPSQVWQEMHDTMLIVLRDFGIQGEAAEKLINTYLLPQHDFTINFSTKNKDDVQAEMLSLLNQIKARKAKGDNNLEFKVGVTGDPNDLKTVLEAYGFVWTQYDEASKTATIALPPGSNIEDQKKKLEDAINKNPAEIESEIKVLDSRQDIVDKATGGNPLKIPAVLDFTPGISGGLNAGGGAGVGGAAGQPVVISGTPNVTINSPAPVDVNGLPAPGQNPMSPNVPPIAPWDEPGPNVRVLKPGESAPLRGSPGQGFPLPWDLPPLTDNLGAEPDKARQSGQAFAQAYADGIRDRIPEVLQAALEMATASTDPLGHSPAKVGPLAGSGWTYFRGRSYSEAYAQGIASGQQAITAAAMGAAGASGDPLTAGFAKLLKDANEWSSFAQHIFDFASKLTDITYNVLNLVQTISGGRAFPKTYQQDPAKMAEAQARRQRQADSDRAKGAIIPGQPGLAGNVSAPQALGPNASRQQIANYIMDKARSEGYSLEQAKAFVVQAVGESGLNPNANGGNQNGSGDVLGIFQFTPDTWGSRPGSPRDAQANIDAYFELARQRGLTPGTMTSGTQLGTQVSIGGPWHPENQANTDALNKALAAARPYLDAYQSGMPPAAYTQGTGGRNILSDTNGLTSGPQVKMAAAIVAQLFPQLKEIGGARSSGVAGTHNAGLAMDIGIPGWDTPEGKALGNQINTWIQQNAEKLGVRYSIWDAQFNPAGGQSKPYSYQGPDPSQAHRNHIDVQFTGQPGQLPTSLSPVPVTLGPNSISPNATPGGPVDPASLGLPEKLQQLAATDQTFAESVLASKGAGMGDIGSDKASQYLQHLDSMIADQNDLNTPESKQQVAALNQIKDGIMANYGMKEGPSGLDSAMTITQNVSGLVSDVFGIVDSSLKSIEGAKNIGDTLVRGIGSTEDIYKIVENVQPFIELGAKISQTVADGLGMAASIAGIAASSSGGMDMGGAQGAAAALGMASSIAGIVSQAFEAVNAAIDLGQEAYRIGTKYLGRALQQWFGLTGSTDVKYLLDTMEGQLKVYSSDNPQMKSNFNTLGRQFGKQYPGREAPANTFYIYQGPGQDPRDTMSDAMFAVKSSGLGAFGYAA